MYVSCSLFRAVQFQPRFLLALFIVKSIHLIPMTIRTESFWLAQGTHFMLCQTMQKNCTKGKGHQQ